MIIPVDIWLKFAAIKKLMILYKKAVYLSTVVVLILAANWTLNILNLATYKE